MTVNDFCSKVNLPGLCLALGIKGFNFKKIPKFGWYAYNDDKSVVCNLFQLLPEDMTPVKAYRMLTLDKPQYLETLITYSEISENKLRNNALYLLGWNALLSASIQDAHTHKIVTKKGKIKLTTLMEEQGYPLLLQNRIGLITRSIITSDDFRWLNLPSSAEDKLIVPSWCTPFHPCSFEIVDPTDLNHRGMLFQNREKGWHGDGKTKLINDISELGYHEGFTWDKKFDMWADKNQIVEISDQLNEEQCIRVWAEAQNITFDRSPIDVVIANKKELNIQHYIKKLTLKQVKELEEKTLLSLRPVWQAHQEEEIQIGGLRFTKKNNRYYLERRPGSEIEFTNFTITLHKIVKKMDGKFYQTGLIYYNDTETAFEMPDSALSSSFKLSNALRQLFLDLGIGIPIILATHRQYLINVIQKFNENIEFGSEAKKED